MAIYYSKVTTIGRSKEAAAKASGEHIPYAQFAVGDSNGLYYEPTGAETALVNETWRGSIEAVYVHPNNPDWVVIEARIPQTSGGYSIREAAVFDAEGDLIIIAKYPLREKPAPESGAASDLRVRMIAKYSNAAEVVLEIDPSLIYATHDYVDARIHIVKTATTANITLSGEQTIDGVLCSVGDRVLVRAQATGANNGIYAVASGAWTRALDFNDGLNVLPGAIISVTEGTAYGDTLWTLATNAPITVGTTALSFKNQATGDASTTVKGVVELATNEETQTGTDTARAVTPSGLASLLNLFGLKGFAKTITDWNDATQDGFYYGDNAANSPVPGTGRKYVGIAAFADADNGMQIVMGVGTSFKYLYYRHKIAGTWESYWHTPVPADGGSMIGELNFNNGTAVSPQVHFEDMENSTSVKILLENEVFKIKRNYQAGGDVDFLSCNFVKNILQIAGKIRLPGMGGYGEIIGDIVLSTNNSSGFFGIQSNALVTGDVVFSEIDGSYFNGSQYVPFWLKFGCVIGSGNSFNVTNVAMSESLPFDVYRDDTNNGIYAAFSLSSAFRNLKFSVKTIHSGNIPEWSTSTSVLGKTLIAATKHIYVRQSDLTTALSSKSDTGHTHSATDLVSGTIPTSRGGTGKSSYTSSRYLRTTSTSVIGEYTPAQVLTDIGAAAAAHSHSLSDITDADFTALKSANGYQKLPSGLIIQWGTVTTAAAPTTVNFPIVFPNACLSVTASASSESTVGSEVFQYQNVNASSFGAHAISFVSGSWNYYAIQLKWIAIGY